MNYHENQGNMYLCTMLNRPSIPILDFDYDLPQDRIALEPPINRSDSKLLVWDNGIKAETFYATIHTQIPRSSVLVFNNSKVIAARLLFEKINAVSDTLPETVHDAASIQNSTIEIFCLEPTSSYCPVLLAMQATQKVQWVCLVGGAKKWKAPFVEQKINYQNELITFRAEKISQQDGKFIIEFSWDHPLITFSEILNLIGQIPLPPYIQRKANEQDKDRYQTTYAIQEGSVAAPTAGLHFSESVFEALAVKNINTQFLTLHVGAGTFMPVKSETIDQHEMHAEFIEVDKSTLEFLRTTNEKIIAVGTTSLRTLESLYWMGVKIINNKSIQPNELNLTQWEAYDAANCNTSYQEAISHLINWMDQYQLSRLITTTQLMITPGYKFRVTKGLITNFHQPKSTLLLIIAAIAGDDWKSVYTHALANKYRFLSYGDGCLFWFKQ